MMTMMLMMIDMLNNLNNKKFICVCIFLPYDIALVEQIQLNLFYIPIYIALHQMYFSQYINCTSLSASTVFLCDFLHGGGGREHTTGASWRRRVHQLARGGRHNLTPVCISSNLSNVFPPIYQLYFFQIFNCISLKFSTVFL